MLYNKGKVLHNLAIRNLWSIKNSKKELEIIKTELEIVQMKSFNDYEEDSFKIKDRLTLRKLQKDDVKDIIQPLLFSLSFEKEELVTFDSLLHEEEFNGFELESLLGLSEIFLSFNEKNIKEVRYTY